MLKAKLIAVRLLTANCVAVFAQAAFPVVGTTYQLDRSRYPDQVAICVTERAMVDYMLAKNTGDYAAATKVLAEVNTSKDFARLKARSGCTLVSSFSQAKVVQQGVGVHRAEFAAFPFGPMWGSPLYFGQPVK